MDIMGSVPFDPVRAPGNETLRVVIVEDEIGLAKMLKAAIERRGFAVTVSSSFDEAVQILSKCHYVAAIVDAKLPRRGRAPDVTHGVELLHVARNAEPRASRLLATGYPREALRRQAASTKSHFAVKPVGLETIFRTVFEGTGLRHRLRESEAFELADLGADANLSRIDVVILAHLVLGERNLDIAQRLRLSQRAFRNHREKILTRIGVERLRDVAGMVHARARACEQRASRSREAP